MSNETKGWLAFIIAVIVIILALWGVDSFFTNRSSTDEKYSFIEYLKDEISGIYNYINGRSRDLSE